MRISGWHVEGFGILHDYRVADLPDGLAVLKGPNEAGKTTLLTFVRSILFGGHDKKGHTLPCPPLRGGRHGGRLFLEVPEGQVIVERFAEKGSYFHLRLPGGQEGSAEDLQRMVGGADAALFQSVFAFNLAQLQELKSLTEERLRNVVFSAGITGAGRSAGQVIQKLEDRSRVLLKVSAGRLFELAARLKELEGERARMESQADTYLSLVEAERALNGKIALLREQVEEERGKKQKYEALLELWPAWCARRQADKDLNALPPVDSFPADAERRLATLTAQLNAAQRAVSGIQNDIEVARNRRGQLTSRPDERLASVATKAQSRADQAALQRSRLKDLIAAKTQSATEQDKLHRSIAELGPGWDEARARSFDTSLPARGEIRDWEARLKRAEEAVREVEGERSTAVRKREDAATHRDRALESLRQARKPDETALAADEGALARIKADLQGLRIKERDQESLRDRQEDADRALRDVEAAVIVSLPAWLSLAFWLATILPAGGAAWRLFQRDTLVGAVLFLLAVACAAAGYFTGRFRAAREAERKRQRESSEHLRARKQGLAESIAVLSEEIAHLKQSIDEGASKLGFKIVAGFYELELKEKALARDRQLLSDWQALDRRLKEAEQALADAVEREKALTEAVRRTSYDESQMQAAWQGWKQKRGVAGLGSPSAVIDFFQQVRDARDQLAARDKALADQQQLETAKGEWEASARELLEAAGLPAEDGAGGEALISAIADLQTRCQQDAANRRKLQELDEALEELNAKLHSAEDEDRNCSAAFRELLDEAGVDDEKAFRDKHELFKQRDDCRRAIQECERQLVARLGLGASADVARAELAAGNVSLWQEAVRAIAAELPNLEAQRDEAIRECTRVEKERQQIEASSDLAAKEAEIAACREDFARAVRQWRVLSMAKGLVDQTLKKFTIERQPAVHADASRFLAAVTDGHYVRVTQDEDSLVPVIFDRDDRQKRPDQDQLSRGTAELLYLCLRLGLAAEFCRRSKVAVPLVMDDVLVNFDPERAGLMARLLRDFVTMPGAPDQMLLFTCHTETVELVRAASPGCAVIELERFGIPKPRAQAATTAGT